MSTEWLSGDRTALIQWNTTVEEDYVILRSQLQTPLPFTEISGQASDGASYYAMRSVGS